MPRFRLDFKPNPARQFKLPERERSTAPAMPELYTHVKPPEWGPGLATAADERRLAAQKAAKRTPRRVLKAQMGAGGLYTVSAPVGPRKGRTILEFTAASDAPMAAFLGTLALRIDRDSVDLSRLENGLLSLAIDHDTGKLLGRVVEGTIYAGRLDMLAEVGDTPTARSAMREIDDLMRAGFSPGFLISETEVIDPDHRDYDENEMVQIEVTRWEPYEISSTAIPRNPNARLRGVASMSHTMFEAPEILHREDMIGLSLAAGREILRSGGGSERQRAKLKEFYAAFEAGLENGLTRDVAARAAKAVVGL